MLALKKVSGNNLTVFRQEVRLMGNKFEFSVVGNDPNWADERINSAIAEINRVEKLLSTFSEDSCINKINRSAGIKPVKVSAEIFNLIDRSLQISELTYGAFDITYYSGDKSEVSHGNDTPVAAYTAVNYKDVVLDAKLTTVFLKEKGMRIGFGANSKGYAADRAKYIMQFEGVSNGVINAGGDLLAWGLQPDLEPWTVAAADLHQLTQPFADLNISDMAFATSVNEEKYASINDKKLNTIKDGFALSEIKSVSILSPTAEFADAMATPVMTIGVNAGVYLINQLNQIGCVIIDDHNRVYPSKGISIA